MKTRHLCVAVGSTAVLALLAGCGSSSSTKTSTAPTGAASAATTTAGAASSAAAPAAASGKVGVILPDTTTSPRWESQDRPNLQKALSAAGITPDIQNAQKDKTKFGTICDSMVNEGVKVLMIVNLDSDSGSACLKKAQNAGIKTIDYDRLTLGGGADYYVSYNNVQVGKLQGQGLLDGLTAAGKTTGAKVAVIDGDPTDNNAALFKQGYLSVLDPAQTAGKIKIVGEQTGKWDATIAGTAFQQIVTQNGGSIDGVLSANDTMAGGIIARLQQDGLAGKVPVTGQDASVAGLQAILAGTQYMTVFKAASGEAQAASTLAIDLIQGKTPDASLINGTTMDTVLKKAVPSALLTPVAITKANVKDAIAGGAATAADVCTGATAAAACTAAGIS